MKKIFSILITSSLVLASFSCEDEDKDRLGVALVGQGAILRTLEVSNPPVNSGNPNSSNISVKVEFDDFVNQDTMESVDYYIDFVDTTPVSNELLSFDEVLLGNIPASAFTTEDGKLVTTLNINIGEAMTALGVDQSVLYGGDIFLLRLALKTTGGDVFTSTNVGTKIQSSSAFLSPFRYSAAVACPPPAELSGDWVLDLQDSYGDGWNGGAIEVSVAGVATKYTIAAGSSASYTVNAPLGELFTFTFISGAWPSEITYQITAPTGEVVANHGPTPDAGGIKLSVDFCASN